MYTDPHLNFLLICLIEVGQVLIHAKRHVSNNFCMIAARNRQTAHSHIGVTDCFDLLQSQQLSTLVKPGKNVVQ